VRPQAAASPWGASWIEHARVFVLSLLADLEEAGGRWVTSRDGASVSYHMETSTRKSRLSPGDLATRKRERPLKL
jgi:hypothetical protein